MIEKSENIILKNISNYLVGFIQLFGLYVIAHGHGSPGGGFQGGCILAASYILLVTTHGIDATRLRFGEFKKTVMNSLGVFIYAFTGLLCLLLGANYLDYAGLSNLFPVDPIKARYFGTFAIEVGVGITVMSIMLTIFIELLIVKKDTTK
jgi:multicomponent Na+:H+ antiporter subunit B